MPEQPPRPSWAQQPPQQPGYSYPTAPEDGPPAPVREGDSRPLHKRKRVWAGAFGIFLFGLMMGSGSNQGDLDKANAELRARPTVTATATVTASPKPAPTVTVTTTATATLDTGAQSTSGGTGTTGSGTSPGNGATAQCNDGTYSYSATHQGTCSHHGGVAVWYQ